MTFSALMAVMRRRWYVPTAILVCSVIATALLLRDGGGYTTTTVVTFTQPVNHRLASDGFMRGPDVIAFAGLIATELNNGEAPRWYAANDAPLYGAGLREGIVVGVPNVAGQWAADFPAAVVEIHIVGRSYEGIAAQQQATLARINHLTIERQVGATPQEAIGAMVDPLTMPISAIRPTPSSQAAAAGAMMGAALIVGAWVAVLSDRLLLGRRRRTPKEAG